MDINAACMLKNSWVYNDRQRKGDRTLKLECLSFSSWVPFLWGVWTHRSPSSCTSARPRCCWWMGIYLWWRDEDDLSFVRLSSKNKQKQTNKQKKKEFSADLSGHTAGSSTTPQKVSEPVCSQVPEFGGGYDLVCMVANVAICIHHYSQMRVLLQAFWTRAYAGSAANTIPHTRTVRQQLDIL